MSVRRGTDEGYRTGVLRVPKRAREAQCVCEIITAVMVHCFDQRSPWATPLLHVTHALQPSYLCTSEGKEIFCIFLLYKECLHSLAQVRLK